MTIHPYLSTALHIALEAGAAVLEVYGGDFSVENKPDDSPLTLADQRSHAIIASGLKPLGIPVLSEEGKEIAYSRRKGWESLWIVDPLDGTKEFIKRNGEFTINIALVHCNRPILGVVYVPAQNRLYFAAKEVGAYRMADEDPAGLLNADMAYFLKTAEPINADRIDLSRPYTIVGSRSHATPELEAYVEKKRREYGRVDFVAAGSSLKFCRVAEGSADLYPRLGPTMEWDTAAGQAVAEAAGASVLVKDTAEPLLYNKEDLRNPWFIVSNNRR
jgi:3'(2'), 5'-bisphosphate nucleotidase